MMGLKKKESKLIKLYCYSRNIGVFFGAKAENGYLTTIIIKVRFNIFCRIDLFPLFIPSIPTFHYSIIPCGLPTRAAAKNTIFLTSCRNSETFNYRDVGFLIPSFFMRPRSVLTCIPKVEAALFSPPIFQLLASRTCRI